MDLVTSKTCGRSWVWSLQRCVVDHGSGHFKASSVVDHGSGHFKASSVVDHGSGHFKASSVVDHGSGHFKDFEFGICCFTAKKTALRSEV